MNVKESHGKAICRHYREARACRLDLFSAGIIDLSPLKVPSCGNVMLSLGRFEVSQLTSKRYIEEN
jgi:hypothetical protein